MLQFELRIGTGTGSRVTARSVPVCRSTLFSEPIRIRQTSESWLFRNVLLVCFAERLVGLDRLRLSTTGAGGHHGVATMGCKG